MLKNDYINTKHQLESGGIEDAAFNSRQLLKKVTGLSATAQIVNGDIDLTDEQSSRLSGLIKKRLERVPLQYLTENESFYGFELEVGEGVLIPRDDTEVAVNLCISYLKGKNGAQVIDLCAGSGAISIALSKLSKAEVVAVELSEKAFYYLDRNITKHKADVKPYRGDVFVCHSDFADAQYDLIVSNPPYIKTDELSSLQPEVQKEPVTALDGGADGCDFYRAVTRFWSKKLKSGGALCFELGEGQAEYVSGLMSRAGFKNITTECDLGGIQRAIIGTMP